MFEINAYVTPLVHMKPQEGVTIKEIQRKSDNQEVEFANIKEGTKSVSVGNRMTIAQYKGLRSSSIIT